MNKKSPIILLTLILASILCFGTWAWAVSTVESNQVEVNVTSPPEYSLTLVNPGDGTTENVYTFSGKLNLDGIATPGKTVRLHVKGPGDTTFVDTGYYDVTDAMGGYSIDWSTTTIGTYTFKAIATI